MRERRRGAHAVGAVNFVLLNRRLELIVTKNSINTDNSVILINIQ